VALAHQIELEDAGVVVVVAVANGFELWSKVVFGVRQGFEGGGGLAENVACLE
jgi:hypothetical protein